VLYNTDNSPSPTQRKLTEGSGRNW